MYSHIWLPMKNNKIVFILSIVAGLLLIPFIAMQVTEEVNWSLFDFLIASILLSITGFTIDYILRKINKKVHRIALSLIVVIMFFLIWAELAVGILETPLSGN